MPSSQHLGEHVCFSTFQMRSLGFRKVVWTIQDHTTDMRAYCIQPKSCVSVVPWLAKQGCFQKRQVYVFVCVFLCWYIQLFIIFVSKGRPGRQKVLGEAERKHNSVVAGNSEM